MGCFSSRFDKRAGAYSSDHNLTGLAFIGGEAGKAYDLFPVDRVSWLAQKDKEVAESCPIDGDNATNTEGVEKAGKAILDVLDKHYKELNAKYGESSDPKVALFANRYPGKDAAAELKEAITFLRDKSGLKADEPEAEKKDEDKKEGEEEKKDETENEGGEDGEAAKEGEDKPAGGMDPPPKPHDYSADEFDYSGVPKLPLALLRCMIVSPVLGNIVKQDVIKTEMAGPDAKVGDFTSIAGLLGHICSVKQTDTDEFFLSGLVSADNDVAALKAISEGADPLKAIHFPFVTFGWKTEDDARAALHYFDGAENIKDRDSKYKQVIFKVTGAKSFEFCKCRRVAHKINGQINKAGEEKDGVTTYHVEAVALEANTIEDWTKQKNAPPPTTAVDPPKAEGDAPEEEKKEDEPPKEE